jgi:hypothetical protein
MIALASPPAGNPLTCLLNLVTTRCTVGAQLLPRHPLRPLGAHAVARGQDA